jgi:hypothetical protein
MKDEGRLLLVVMWGGRYVEFSRILVGLDGLDFVGEGGWMGKADGKVHDVSSFTYVESEFFGVRYPVGTREYFV